MLSPSLKVCYNNDMKKPKGKVTMEGIAELIADSQKLTVKRLDKRITESYESLARSVAEGFRGVDKRFESVDKRFDEVEGKLGQQIQGLGNRIDDLALNRATREEFLVLDKRVGRIETQLGLDFKKSEHA